MTSLSANKLYEASRFCQDRKLKRQALKISVNIKQAVEDGNIFVAHSASYGKRAK